MLVARTGHPLAGRDEVAPRELLDYPWVALANDYVGSTRINSFFAANELDPPRVAVETTSTSGMFSMLRSDDFIIHLPILLLPYAEAVGLTRLAVRGTLWESSAGIAYRTSRSPIPAINSFCAMVRSHFAI